MQTRLLWSPRGSVALSYLLQRHIFHHGQLGLDYYYGQYYIDNHQNIFIFQFLSDLMQVQKLKFIYLKRLKVFNNSVTSKILSWKQFAQQITNLPPTTSNLISKVKTHSKLVLETLTWDFINFVHKNLLFMYKGFPQTRKTF